MKWNNRPVNSLSLKLLEQSIETLKTLEQDPKCGALILTSVGIESLSPTECFPCSSFAYF